MIILITLLAVANGALLTLPVIEKTSPQTRIAVGSVIGIAILSWIAFLTALPLGLNATSIGTTVAILIMVLVIQLRFIGLDRIMAGLREFKASKTGVVYYAAWTALLAWLFARVVMFYPDGLHTAPANNYGDLPFHFSAITSFAYGENLPPQNPIFAGMKFTYPFLIDFLTAFFIRCGADWRSAFFVENIALSLALVRLIETLTLKIFKNSAAARLAPVIFLFNGGFGFINFFRDFSAQGGALMDFAAHMPNTFTMNADLTLESSKIPLRWGNVFTTLLIPQRSMLFGLPLVAMIITLWWMSFREESDAKTRRRYLLSAGILAGLLPMLHAHGFFSVMIASAPMALLFWSLDWGAFFAPVAILAAPQAWYLSGTQIRNQLFKPLEKWWEAGDANPLLFWMINAGIFILLLLSALLIRKITNSRQALFYLPFALWFIIPNFVALAPWTWDNIKMLVYWSLASTPFVAAALAYLFTRRFVVARAAVLVLFVALTFSGALDVTRALSPAENVVLFGQVELEVAALLREKTPPRALILHAPIHNSVVALSGRQSVMGYPGHLWTHGIPFESRQNDVTTIYKGGAQMIEPLSRLGVDYVVIGPAERGQLEVNENSFANSYPLVIDHAGYRIYRVRN
ncbi:MAG: hypothetical protein AB7U82_32765 [Blastocatellales bacterium]